MIESKEGDKMDVRHLPDSEHTSRMTTAELRNSYLVNTLFNSGELNMVYIHLDRAIVGTAIPTDKNLTLEASRKELAADFFLERREIGILNIGKKGEVIVDKKDYVLDQYDCLYLGTGNRSVEFVSDDPKEPAEFYFLSYPAHAKYPNALMMVQESTGVAMGSAKEANQRTIHKYIFSEGIKSCQLVMGMTVLKEGSVWNTMPAHTHERRSEIYLYFDVPDNAVVCHLMGKPEETRHLIIRNKQAVISPSWSIHSAAGTQNYSFIWGMGGENQDFNDMDGVTMSRLM